MIWFTSDLHFCHNNVLEYCPNRQFSNIEEMNYVLLQNYNYYVRDNDTVFILGDLTLSSFDNARQWISQLRGKKFLIRGNHDKFSRSQYLSLGFTEVFNEAKIQIGKTVVSLSHYPYKPDWWARWFTKAKHLRYMERRPRKDGSWLLHGHTHSQHKIRGTAIHVGVDAWDLKPVSINQIQSIIDKERNK